MSADPLPRPPAPVPRGWFRSLTDSGHDTTDDAALRRQKSVFTGASFLKAGMCPLWCAMFLSVGAWVAAAIPLIYAAVTGLSIAQMARNKDINGFRSRQAWFIFLAPAGVTLAIGGLHASSSVILWSFLAPVIALLFAGPRSAVRWLLGFFGLVTVSLLELGLRGRNSGVPKSRQKLVTSRLQSQSSELPLGAQLQADRKAKGNRVY